MNVYMQGHLPTLDIDMVKAQAQYFWMMFAALGLKIFLLTVAADNLETSAPTADLILKMLLSFVR